ncbi:hypothetical protein [Bacillus piscicola]|uniref:hypothetical protein n=1 Tax=Bacillus piscicola TaxID=1632684 RepID=UPI001F09CFAD|nr:hypothetical protein [Bacillus piscicola]
MKSIKYLQVAFLFVGVLAVLEFTLIRGMFSWLIAVAAVIVVGSLNVIVNFKHKEWLHALLYILSTVALCMGYFVVM